MPTPSPDVLPALRQVVEIWKDVVERFVQADGRTLDPESAMSVAVTLLDQQQQQRSSEYDELVAEIEASPLAARDIRTALARLLQSDSHLQLTCGTTWRMASALEKLRLDSLSRNVTLSTLPNTDDIVTELMARLFETDYRRCAFFHVYNVAMSEKEIVLPMPEAHLLRLTEADAAQLVNEPTQSSRLHRESTGNAFIRIVDSGAGDDWVWLTERWKDAYNVVRILRFLKSGTVDLDWAGLHFFPSWVNEVRKYGISLLGRPRWDVQAQRFDFGVAEHERLIRYLTFYLGHLDEIDDTRSHVRKATMIAGNYFESHHARTSIEDKLIDLVISLEALFSPAREGEFRFRISLRGALLLGNDADSRRRVFQLMKRAYDARSSLVHGDESPFETGRFSEQDLAALASEVRVAILRLLTLHMRGYRNRDDALAWIDDAAFSAERHRQFLDESDFEKYLAEQDGPR